MLTFAWMTSEEHRWPLAATGTVPPVILPRAAVEGDHPKGGGGGGQRRWTPTPALGPEAGHMNYSDPSYCGLLPAILAL